MANLTINIVTKYAEAEKGFSKVAGSLTKYRNELLKANAEGKVTEQNWANYKQALNNALIEQDLTKEGMAKLTAQAKILGKELGQIGMAFGENDETYKRLDELLTNVKSDMRAPGQLTKAVSKNIKAMGEEADKTSLKLLAVAKNILKFQLLMAPITALVRGFRNTLSDSVKVAAEAEQVFSKLSTVFDGFSDSAKRTASSLASSIGVANSTAASALSTVGDLLQAQGMGTSQSLSTASEWVKQFQDIIAFKDINMSLEEFAQNFMSGAAGNLRNFRTFGSIVKESAVNAELAKKGLDKLTGSQLELAKMTTRAEMALEQQANAMGATEREWDTMLSVNRRLSEAQKEWKENFGEGLNTMLKPVKSWWTELLESINKTNKALAEFADKTKEIGAFDIHNNKNDAANFRGAMRSILPGIMHAGYSLEAYASNPEEYGNTDYANNPVVREIEAQMRFFSATVQDVREIFGTQLSEGIYEYLKAQEAETRALQAETKNRENRYSSLSSAFDSYSAFTEALASITGVGSLNTLDYTELFLKNASQGAGSTDTVMSLISGGGLSAVDEAMAKMASASLETWGDVISGALDGLDDGELLKNKAESYRQFFEAVHNYFGKDGDYSADELTTLENIKNAYKATNEEAKKYQERLEAETGIKGHISNAQDVLWEAATRQRLTDEGKPSDQMSIWIKYEKALEELNKQFAELGKETVEINGQLFTLEDAENKLKEARQSEIDAMLQQERLEAQTSLQGYLSQFEESEWERQKTAEGTALGISDDDMSTWIKYEKIIKDVREQFAKLAKGEMVEYNGQLYNEEQMVEAVTEARQAEIDAIKKEEEEVRKLTDIIAEGIFGENANAGYAQKFSSAVANSSGGQLVQAGMDGGVVGILVEILAQTETFTETLKAFDPIITTFSEFIKPILPAVQLIFNVINELVFSILKPFFPIIKGIAMVVASLAYPIKVVTNVIKNIYTAVHNILERIIHPITGGDRWNYVSLTDGVDEITGIIRDIKNMTFDIKENTDPKNSELLKAYNNMFRNGLITASEYQGLLHDMDGLNYDNMRTYQGSAWNNGRGGTTIVYNGDMHFTIDGTNLSAEEIAEAVTRKQKEWATTGQYA